MKFSNLIIFLLLYSTTTFKIKSNPIDKFINFFLRIETNKSDIVFNSINEDNKNYYLVDNMMFNSTLLETQVLLYLI